MISTIILASAFSCTTIGTITTCREVDEKAATENTSVYVFQRLCVAKVPAIHRDKYPGGAIQLMKDCEAQARAHIEARNNAMRNHDQNGVQSR